MLPILPRFFDKGIALLQYAANKNVPLRRGEALFLLY